MMNQAILIGRIVKMDKDTEGKVVMTVAVSRSYKNTKGEYDTDMIKVQLMGNIASNTFEYCRKGDLVGIKGSMQSKKGSIIVVGEKITFLSNKEHDPAVVPES